MNAADSPLVLFGVPALAVTLTGLLIWATARVDRDSPPRLRRRRVLTVAVGAGLWMTFLAGAASSGALARFDLRPPPLMGAMLSVLVVAFGLGLSPLGRRLALGLPLWVLVGVQGFRLPLELIMHHAARQGIMPSVMSFSGYNFDIIAGSSAVLLGSILAVRRVPLVLIAAWNLTGVLLLMAIGGIALAATPIFRAFGDDQLNIWVAHFPYVWMLVMVAFAALGHVLVTRRLLAERRARVQLRSSTPVPSAVVS